VLLFRSVCHQVSNQADKLDLLAIFINNRRFAQLFKWLNRWAKRRLIIKIARKSNLSAYNQDFNLLNAALPTLQFSREFGLVFCGDAVFLKTCGLLVCGLVLIKICLFFGLVFCRFLFCGLLFFQILWHFCSFNSLQNEIWECFCVNLDILGLFFSDLPPWFYI